MSFGANMSNSVNSGNKFGYRNAAAVGISVLAVAAAIYFRPHKPAPEPPKPQECAKVVPCPVPDMSKCNLDVGMNTPASKNYKPELCGFCGDGKPKSWEQPPWAKPIDPFKVICEADFHCGDGVLTPSRSYSVQLPPTVKGGAPMFTDIIITESCDKNRNDYCPADCPPESGKADVGKQPKKNTDDSAPAPTATAAATAAPRGGPCDETNSGIAGLKTDMKAAIDGSVDSFRNAYGASGKAKVSVTISVSVSADGRVTGYSAYSSCSGSSEDCPKTGVNANTVLGSQSGLYRNIAPPPAVDCNLSVTRRVSGG